MDGLELLILQADIMNKLYYWQMTGNSWVDDKIEYQIKQEKNEG